MIWLNIHTFPIQWEPENFGIWRRLVDSSFKSPMNEKHKFNKLIVKLFAFVTASNTQYCFPCPQFSGFPCTLYSVLYCTVYCTVYIMVLYIMFCTVLYCILYSIYYGTVHYIQSSLFVSKDFFAIVNTPLIMVLI